MKPFKASSLLSLLALVPSLAVATSRSKGCDLDKPILPLSATTLVIDTRSALISIPKTYKHGQAAPLIVAYHDAGSTAESLQRESALSTHQNNTHFVVVYPRAEKGELNGADDEASDLTLTSALLDEVNAKLCIDTNRVYATGLGSGAGFADRAACDSVLSSRFAAYAMVNGAFGSPTGADNATMPECTPARPASRILSIHGQSNPVHPYFPKAVAEDDSEESPAKPASVPLGLSVVQWLVSWAIRANCGASYGHPEPLEATSSADGPQLTRLQRGSLTEAYTHDEGVIAASYKCWQKSEHEIKGLAEKLIRKYDTDIEPFGDIENKPEDMERFVVQRIDEIVAGSTAGLEKLRKMRESKGKEDAEEERQQRGKTVAFSEKGGEVLRHFAVQGAGHGWLRLERKDTAETDGLWEPLQVASSATKSTSSQVAATTFDSTAEVLQWFAMHRLSDTLPSSEIEEDNVEEFLSAINDESGITEFLKEMSEQITIKDQITRRLLGDLKKESDPNTEIGKQRAKERKAIREKYEKLQKQEGAEKEGAAQATRDEL